MANFRHFATFPIFPTEVVQNNSEWPILAILQLFQYFSLICSPAYKNIHRNFYNWYEYVHMLLLDADYLYSHFDM